MKKFLTGPNNILIISFALRGLLNEWFSVGFDILVLSLIVKLNGC
jgi:hypothetical protein